MLTSVTERVVSLMEEESLTPSTYADRIGVQRSSMSHILSGRNKPSLEMVQKTLAAFPHVNPEWLVTGNGDMFQFSMFEEDDPKKEPSDEKSKARKKKKEAEASKFQVDPEANARFQLMQKAFNSIGEDVVDDIPRPKVKEEIPEEPVFIADKVISQTPRVVDAVYQEKPLKLIPPQAEIFAPAQPVRDFSSIVSQSIANDFDEKAEYKAIPPTPVEIPEIQQQSPAPKPVMPNIPAEAFMTGKKIERIVVFYDDKTFSVYNPE